MHQVLFRLFAFAILCTLSLPASGQQYRWGPDHVTPEGSPVIFFDHREFGTGGGSKQFTRHPGDYYIGRDLEDRISSIVIPKGVKVTFYEHRGRQGRSVTLFPGNYPYLKDFEDKISSFTIEPFDDDNNPLVLLYEHDNLPDRVQAYQSFAAGEYDKPRLLCNDCFTTMQVNPGITVRLYKHPNKGGAYEPIRVDGNSRKEFNLHDTGMNDAISMVAVDNTGYVLESIEFVNETISSKPAKEPIGVSQTVTNTGSGPSNMETKVTYLVGTTVEKSKSTTKEYGFSLMVGHETEVGVKTIATVKLKTEFTSSFGKAINEGTTTGKSFSTSAEMSQTGTVPGKCKARLTVFSIPVIKTVETKEIYREVIGVNRDSSLIFGPNRKFVKNVYQVKEAYDTEAIFETNCGSGWSGADPITSTPPATTSTPTATTSRPTVSTPTDAQNEFGYGDDANEVNLPATFVVYRDGRQYSEIEWDSEESVWSEWDMEGDWLADYRETERNSLTLILVDTDSGKELTIDHNGGGSITVKPSSNAANSSIDAYGSLTAADSGGMGNGRGTTTAYSDNPPPSSYGEETFGYDAESIREAGDTGSELAEESFDVFDEDGYFLCQLSYDASQNLWLEIDDEDDLVGEYRVTERNGQRLQLREIDYGTVLTVDLSSGEVYSDSSGELELMGTIDR